MSIHLFKLESASCLARNSTLFDHQTALGSPPFVLNHENHTRIARIKLNRDPVSKLILHNAFRTCDH